MINCKDVDYQSSDYLNGDLPLLRRLNIALHIFICHRCRRYLKQLRLTTAAISALKPKEETTLDTKHLVDILLQEQQNMEPKK